MTQTHAAATTFLTSRDAGRLIQRTPAAIRRAAALGLLHPVAVTSAGERLYLPEDVLAYARQIEARRRGVAA